MGGRGGEEKQGEDLWVHRRGTGLGRRAYGG
jgi:hypothetical protein